MSTQTKNAPGTLRIGQHDWMKMKGGIGGIETTYIETDVEILLETPGSYHIEYNAKFKKEHADLCKDNVIRKDDKDRRITCTSFTHPMQRCWPTNSITSMGHRLWL